MASVIIASVDSARTKGLYARNQQLDANFYHNLGDSLIAQYLFNDCTGSTLTDSSGFGNYATLTGSPAWSNIDTPFGRGCSISFNGSNQYAQGSQVVNMAQGTVSAWVKISSVPTQVGFITGFINGLGGGQCDKDLTIGTDGKLYFYIWDGSTQKVTSVPAATVPLNTWVFVLGTVDGTTVRAYMNGGLVGSISAGNSQVGYSNPDIFLSGAPAASSIPYCGGYMAEQLSNVRIYNRSLDTSEIRSIYLAEAPAHGIALK